ncbi:ferredoxin [Candidatus Bathyarchaeota archaeon RBG_13_60_20]|nr:MAG: ferredoxin [Candidatus Bathyarchaeota archaeon RBG_13_60_20]
MTVRVLINPTNRELEAEVGDILLDRMREEGVHIEALCGGKGFCGKCRVILERGRVEKRSTTPDKLLSEEELSAGYHLACMVRLVEDCEFTIPAESRVDSPKILMNASLELPERSPAASKHLLASPGGPAGSPLLAYRRLSLRDYQGTAPRVSDQVYEALNRMREGEVTVTVSRTSGYPEVIMAEPGDARNRCVGLAMDIGTTTIVSVLADLSTGRVLGTASGMNKQITYGEDLVTRVAVARNEEGLRKLQRAAVSAINEVLGRLYSDTGLSPGEVVDVAVGGNTVMNHLFAGLESGYLEIANVEVPREPIIVKAGAVGLDVNPEAYVYCLPNVSRYLGGDAVGDVVASGMHRSGEMSLMIDLGTNGEIVFGNDKWLFSCSCASGPAFEGEGVRHGMRAAVGGIDHVWIDPETKEARFSTIGDAPAKGICGSGLIDLVAELFRAGVMDFSGKFVASAPYVREGKWGMEYLVVPAERTSIGKDIVLTQGDLDYVIDSKAAACGAVTVLMKKLRIGINDVRHVYLAGAFGTYTDMRNATTLGIFPKFPNAEYHPIGNGSLSGAYATLVSVEKRREAADVARKMVYVDLLVDVEFIEEYSKALYVPGAKEYFPA